MSNHHFLAQKQKHRQTTKNIMTQIIKYSLVTVGINFLSACGGGQKDLSAYLHPSQV